MAPPELLRRIVAAAERSPDVATFFAATDRLARSEVDHAVAAWSTQDPATGLFTSCTMVGLPKDPAREAALFAHEWDDDEPATYARMVANGATVAVLSDVTGGDLSRAARHRELLSAFGVSDELRVLFWSADAPWGSVTLYRNDGATFDRPTADSLARLAPTIGDGIRRLLLRMAANRPEALEEPPGILRVTADGEVVALTAPARDWLAVGGPQLVTTAVATAAAVRARPDWPGAHARIALDDGRVVRLHAAATVEDDGTVAVVVDRARRIEVGALLVDAHGLSPRQRDVLGLLLLGRSMAQVAAALGISEHTAHDHRKALYRAFDVASRSELAALLQAEHYGPRSSRGVPPSPYGGFLE